MALIKSLIFLETHSHAKMAPDTGALSRQAKKLCDAVPKLRAKDAARVIEMLLDDDCLSASRAAKRARLSDRGVRRLFDRLVELNAVRELTERSNFRLYGL